MSNLNTILDIETTPKKGAILIDTELNVSGVIKNADDLHNVFVSYVEDEDGESYGFYCLDPSCPDYDNKNNTISIIGKITPKNKHILK